MSFDVKNFLKLLVSNTGRDARTANRISVFSVVIPIVFGGLALYFSYSKVSFSEKKYSDMFLKLNKTKQEYRSLKNQLDSSQQFIVDYENRLNLVSEEYSSAKNRLLDSMNLQENNINTLRDVYFNIEKNYRETKANNASQNQLLASNTALVQKTNQELKRLNDSIAWLKNSLQVSKDSLQYAMAEVEFMKSSLESMAGEAVKIKPISRSRTLFGHKDNHNRQLFEFAVWLNIPKSLRKHISEVTYKYNLPSEDAGFNESGFQSISISDEKTDFKTAYTSWGCVKNMIIQIKFKSNYSVPIYFDLCSSLNNPLIEELPSR